MKIQSSRMKTKKQESRGHCNSKRNEEMATAGSASTHNKAASKNILEACLLHAYRAAAAATVHPARRKRTVRHDKQYKQTKNNQEEKTPTKTDKLKKKKI